MNKKALLQIALILGSFLVVGFFGYQKLKPMLSHHQAVADEESELTPEQQINSKMIEESLADLSPEERRHVKALEKKMRAKMKESHSGTEDSEILQEIMDEEIQAPPKRTQKARKPKPQVEVSDDEASDIETPKRVAGAEAKHEKKQVTVEDAEEFLRRARENKDNVEGIFGL
jgi:hypothetical protein